MECIDINGVHLPICYSQRMIGAVVFGHGLDQMTLSHESDEFVALISESCQKTNITCVTYTARGHGESNGWQCIENTAQFHWSSLAKDMALVAAACDLNTYVIGGHSMGAGTSIYCAIQEPAKVKAMILVRPPCAWQTRQARKAQLLNRANAINQKGDIRHKVIEGAAGTDLPPLREDGDYSDSYAKITCPVLILAFKHDDAHPVSTSEQLKLLIPHAKLFIMENEQEAKMQWPLIVEQFLKEVYCIE